MEVEYEENHDGMALPRKVQYKKTYKTVKGEKEVVKVDGTVLHDGDVTLIPAFDLENSNSRSCPIAFTLAAFGLPELGKPDAPAARAWNTVWYFLAAFVALGLAVGPRYYASRADRSQCSGSRGMICDACPEQDSEGASSSPCPVFSPDSGTGRRDPKYPPEHGWYITGNWGETLITSLYPPNACDRVGRIALDAWTNLPPPASGKPSRRAQAARSSRGGLLRTTPPPRPDRREESARALLKLPRIHRSGSIGEQGAIAALDQVGGQVGDVL